MTLRCEGCGQQLEPKHVTNPNYAGRRYHDGDHGRCGPVVETDPEEGDDDAT